MSVKRLNSFLNMPCAPRFLSHFFYSASTWGRWCYGSRSLGGARLHFETFHGIVPGLIIILVEPIRRLLRTFHQQRRRRCDIKSAKQTLSLLTVGGCAADVATTTRILAFSPLG